MTYSVKNQFINRFVPINQIKVEITFKLLLLLTGKINAKAVHAKAPVRLMNRPNLGIMVALIPTPITIIVRKIIFLM